MPVRFLRSGLVALALFCAATPLQAANWLEMNFWMSGPRYSGRVPACDSGWALARIQYKFASKEGRFWNSSLSITSFDGIHETGYRPWAQDTIPRRFCSAIATISDGVRWPIHYLIAEDQGPIGAVFGVDSCVVGLDRNWAYGPACRMARP
ncbi:MAG: hypothetical protein ABUL48_00950 [Pseudorhodoplanes sp.]